MALIEYSTEIVEVHPNKLHANPDNPRTSGPGDVTELSRSIKELGVLEPLLVRSAFQRFGDGHYMIDAGERRWTASRPLGILLPCRVGTLAKGVEPAAHTLITGLVENGSRENLNPIERAKAYSRLMREFGYTQTALAIRLGVSPTTISKTMNLLDLAPRTQQAVVEKKLSVTDANRLVITHREKQRQRSGQAQRSVEWEPDHLSERHFLAGKARRLCSGSEHQGTPRLVGGVACGRHWERVIREDEAKVQQLAARDAGFDIPFTSSENAAAGNSFGHGAKK